MDQDIKVKEEGEFLLHKTVECPVCDKKFESLQLKSNRARMLEPDIDLRPRSDKIDTVKYGVLACPHCGYSAIKANFDMITSAQKKLIREGVCDKFHSAGREPSDTYTYQMAIDFHKLALLNTVAKRGRASEKAYTCLRIAWLDRGMREDLEAEQAENPSERNQVMIKMLSGEEEKFIGQAYNGFVEAMANETPPFCGLDMNTVEYLIAVLAWKTGDLDVAAKTVSNLLVSKSTSRHVKDKALNLKELIMEDKKKQEES